MTLDELTERVAQRLEEKPRALILGAPPPVDIFDYVNDLPYEAVVLGLLPPGLLLAMPTEPVCRAILSGMPVYLWANQPYRRWPHGKLLQRELREAQARLIRLGAREWRGERV